LFRVHLQAKNIECKRLAFNQAILRHGYYLLDWGERQEAHSATSFEALKTLRRLTQDMVRIDQNPLLLFPPAIKSCKRRP
jgi:hypothetical protein